MRLFFGKTLLLEKWLLTAKKGILWCSCDSRLRATLAVSPCGLAAGGSGRLRGADDEVVEVGGPAESFADAVAGQHVLVGLVAAQLPLLSPWRQRRNGRLGKRPPGPLGDRRVAAPLVAGRLDEVRMIGVVAHPVPHEPKAGERGLRLLPLPHG